MSGLDPIGRREVRDLIGSLRETGTTVFLCSHILADIEVLCDRAAVMQRGRLAHVGRLDELRQLGGERGMELTVTGGDVSRLTVALAELEGSRLTTTPGGARIEVPHEHQVDAALGIMRASGARLVSIQPVGNPLEELFMTKEMTKEMTSDEQEEEMKR